MKALLTLLTLSLFGCGPWARDNNYAPTKQDLKELVQKKAIYRLLSKNVIDQYGFINPPKCDSVKYTGYYVASGSDTNILQAESADDPGRFYRHAEHDCYTPPVGDSPPDGSSFSRDMALGLAHAFWHKGDVDSAKRFMAYVDSHEGRMGEGDVFRTDLRPGLTNTFHAIISRSEGVPLPPKVEDPDPEAQEGAALKPLEDYLIPTGYEAELSVSHILLRGLVFGALSDFEIGLLKKQVEREPKNAFYQAVYHKFTDGDQSLAMAILFDESLFPADKLPTSSQYCTDYIWQRDNLPKDWGACPEENLTHSGADFLFAASVVIGTLRQAPN